MNLMKNIDDIAVIVQARLSSKRLPRKMILPFAGSSLYELALRKLVGAGIPAQQLYTSINDIELINIAKKYPVNIFHRSPISAHSDGKDIPEIFEWYDKIPFKYCVLVSACCPFLKPSTICQFFEYFAQLDLRGLFSVVERRNYFWSADGEILTPRHPDRKDLDTQYSNIVYEGAHTLYAGTMEDIANNVWMGSFASPNDPGLYVISEQEALDIDYKWQYEMYEAAFSSQCFDNSKVTNEG